MKPAIVAVLVLCCASWLLPTVKAQCINQEVRVVDGPSDGEGRAEVCINSVYYQICDDGWSQNDAKVFCNKLGFSVFGAQAYGLSKYGSEGIPIQQSNYMCAGTEDDLSACATGDGTNCGTDRTAGVKCNPKGTCEAAGHTECCTSGCNAGSCYCDTACYGFGDCCEDITNTCPDGNPALACTNGEVRLFNGFNMSIDGRVEFCPNGQWTTVCNDDGLWDSLDAQVVCSQLGVPQSNPVVYTGPTPYGQGDVGIAVRSFQCTGQESSLTECPYDSNVDCGHQFDVGVDCGGACTNNDVLISSSDNSNGTGVVLLCVDGSWAYISDDGWDFNDAKVVCNAEGYSSFDVHAYGGDNYGAAKISPTLTNFECTGNESSLSSCSYSTTSNGDVNNIASVQCNSLTICEAAGHTGCCTSGCNAGGCYCDAACHGFGDCCDGIEATCSSTTCDQGDVRLVGGSSQYEGTVEVCVDGKFSVVCDNSWDDKEAMVVCGQLSYATIGATATTDSYFFESNLTLFNGAFSCLGNEALLTDCPNVSTSCGHQNEAGVRCPVPCDETGALQLVGGETYLEGRVEVCEDGVWRTICQGELWSQEDAVVTCAQLGYSTLSAVAYGDSYFGEGAGIIAASDIQCIGTESYLTNCANSTALSCDHSTDVGVLCGALPGPCALAGHTDCCISGCNVGGCYCDAACHGFGDCCSDIQTTCPDGSLSECTNDDIRISGGGNTNKGLVEFCVDGKWTSICDEDWDANEAAVVCQQAGFSSIGAVAIEGSFFGQDGGPIEKGGFGCTGTEAQLSDCSYSDSTCSQHMSAGVVCAETCDVDGDIRLIGGADETSGYVEVCTGGSWGAICDADWCEQNAKVICAQLGYSSNRAEAYGASYFGQDIAPIQFTSVNCNGDEGFITECSNSSSIPATCSTNRLAGVKCFVLSSCENNGIIDCCNSNCNPDGCYCDLACHGFGDCCDNIDNTCPSTSTCTNGLIRLVDGTDSYEGRLEVCVNGQWGTVCDNGFSEIDGRKACAQLDLPTDDVTVFDSAYFGQGDNPVVASDFSCNANDNNLNDCGFSTGDDFCCGHHRDVGVRCEPGCVEGGIKLAGGSSDLEGTVSICIKGQFRTICDDGWSTQDATVFCRELGYSSLDAHAYGQSVYNSSSTLSASLTNMQCQGTESSWIQCQYSENPTCDSTGFAGVKCSGEIGSCEAAGHSDCCTFLCSTNDGCYCDAACHGFGDCCEDIQTTCPAMNCTDGETRIVNDISNEMFAGKIELCINGQWGSICDDGWSYNEAHVVCSQFGYTSYGSVPATGSKFGQSLVQIVASNFTCNGFEDTIHDCPYTASPDCGHHEEAGVYCNVPCTEGDVRLVNASSLSEGRVEVCSNKSWHPVCDEKWSTDDAIVVCRQLGFSVIGAQAFGHSLYGNGLTLSMSYGYNCTSWEGNLTDCMTIEVAMCDAESTAGVKCGGEVSICEAAGHTGCCTSGCNAGGCYCDAVCHIFSDCCDGIDLTCAQTQCTNGDVRLIDGESNARGRVEACVDGQWGTVCDDDWSSLDAGVVCGQIGYPTIGAAIKTGAYFGQGTGDIVAGSFQCDGTESELLDCVYTSEPSCGHHQDAGVICPEPCEPNGIIRIADGSSEAEGRIEFCLNGQWSSLCADDQFCGKSSNVLCKQAGFSSANSEAYGIAKYGEGGGVVGIENLNCLGTEDNYTQCQFNSGSSCPHSMDAGIKCNAISPCELAGHTECCTSGCFNSQYGCWCDAFCHFFNDCCDNIESTCPSGGCTDGEKRFINGNDTSGIVNVCYNFKWQTVCGDSFGDAEAKVACKSQGLHEEGFTIHDVDYYGQGEGAVYAKQFGCTGNENSILDCSGNEGCCSHSKDIGLTCQYACEDGDIRLVGGDNEWEGRVEVCYNRRWGTICDDSWGENDARVACKMAGFPWRGAVATSFASFGQGVGPIHLDDVECNGTEESLWNCTATVSDHNCAHFEDAGVMCASGPCELAGHTTACCDNTMSDCQGKLDTEVCHCDIECELHGDCCVDADLICKCEENDIRLINGANEKEGRVEICINGQYGTVCDDLFDINEGKVVCRQLGYPDSSVEVFSFSYFGQGTGPIQLDNLQCIGNETQLINCPSNGVGNHNCAHFEDASVRCADPICTNGDTRLVHGGHQYTGRIEVCVNGVWGTVCDDLFDDVDALVACKSLNLPYESATWFTTFFSYPFDTALTAMDDVECTGSEEHILDCDHTTNHNCAHFEDVGLTCNPPCSYDGEIRLIGGTDATNGRLEVCTGGQWGTVCDDAFDNNDAKVVCRQLGLPTESARSLLNLQYGAGTGDIKYSEVECVGNETHLINCTKLTSSFFCFHGEDVGISCEPGCVDGELKLVDGKDATEGRVEVCRAGMWGTICDNSGSWGIHEARVICNQLGFPFTAAQVASFGAGGDPIQYANVNCDGSELNVASCSKIIDQSLISCFHSQDVGVTCEEACTIGEVRLVDGSDPTNGRFEICIGGTWGTVCDEEFHNVDAKVVCKQLGLAYEGAEAIYDGTFGYGDDDVAITTLHCTGSESHIFDCFFTTGSSVSSCSHSNDIGVICQDVCSNGDIRLADGVAGEAEAPPASGRVEVCFNSEWGTVCENGWSTNDAQVTCGQLGFQNNPEDVRTFGGYKYGGGIGNIYFSDITCTGTETCLVTCPSSIDTSSCTHNEDAGVRCEGVFTPSSLSVDEKCPTSCNLPPPSVVTNVTVDVDDNTLKVEIRWNDPDVTNGIITGYNFTVSGQPSLNTFVSGGSPNYLSFTSLVAGTPYTFSLTALNLCGVSVVYTDTFFTAELSPTAPTISSTVRLTGKSFSVDWGKLSLAQARGILSGYEVSWAIQTSDATYSSVQVTTDTSTYVYANDNLAVDKNYNVRVRGKNSAGLGDYSTEFTVPTTKSVFVQVKIFLQNNQDCGTWLDVSGISKVTDLIKEVSDQIQSRCSCGFTSEYLVGTFQCNPSETQEVHFRGELFSTSANVNVSVLASNISDWLTTEPKVTIDGVVFDVDSTCVVVIDNQDVSLCKAPSSSSATGGVVIGTSVVVVIVVIVLLAGLIIFIVVLVRRVRGPAKYGSGDASNEMVGYSNQMAFPEGMEDNISQRAGSTIHDDDFQQAISMITDEVDQDMEKKKLDQMYSDPKISFSHDGN